MFMYPTQYKRPQTIEEASDLLAALPDARPLAGGQSLIAAMKLRLASAPELVDLGAITGLSSIQLHDQKISIGAMARHCAVAGSTDIAAKLPALCALAAGIGDRQVRNMGTMGGSVANNDPAADYPAAVLALDAVVSTTQRAIAADDFFQGIFETALEPGELITAITYQTPRRAAYVKFKNPASRFALVGIFVADFGHHVRVAVTGAGACVFRAHELEQALQTRFDPGALEGIRISPDELGTDLHASAAYRAHLITALSKRAVQVAIQGQTGPVGE